MGELRPVMLIHAWFWLVALLTISFQRAPMLTALFIFTGAFMFWVGYLTGWNNSRTAQLHEDA